jgi:hypothetical protein
LVRNFDRLFHSGPVIRDLTVPEQEIPLKPAPLRRRGLLRLLRGQLYRTALVAWTLGLALATYGLLHNAGARSDSSAARMDAQRPETADLPPHP